MKLIISHDIDHLSVREHLGDLVLPKFAGTCTIEFLKRCISLKTFGKRISGLWRESAWNNVEELLEFDKKHNVKSTFFVAVNNGLGLSYTLNQAERVIKQIEEAGFDVGVHGISYRDFDGIEREYKLFRKLSNRDEFGMRMHYLRRDNNTLRYLREAGYAYDTSILSENELHQPYVEGGLPEFPIHLQDMLLFSPFHRSLSLDGAIKWTEGIFRKSEDGVLNVLLHPRYFSDEFPRYKRWYEWLVSSAIESGAEFVSYEELVKNKVKNR